MFRAIAWAYGHVSHFWAKVVGAVVVCIFGWFWGDIMQVMVAYTLVLTVMTDLGTVVIQNTGSHDTEAIQLKLDELIRSHREARNEYIGIEKGKAR